MNETDKRTRGTEEKTLPCPYCGKEVREYYNCDSSKKKLWCGCGYESTWVGRNEDHVSHNRLARAVMVVRGSEVK